MLKRNVIPTQGDAPRVGAVKSSLAGDSKPRSREHSVVINCALGERQIQCHFIESSQLTFSLNSISIRISAHVNLSISIIIYIRMPA